MQPSKYQADIIKAVQDRIEATEKKGLVVEALAGCGKSTILWMIAKDLSDRGFKPNEVVAVVFGKKNQVDLQAKFSQKVGSSWGACVRTIHSLCYEIYRSALGVSSQRVKVETAKYKKIAQELGLLPLETETRSTPGSLLEDGLIFAEKDFLDLLDRLRLYCLEATPENVKFLVELYKLGIKKDFNVVGAAAASCLSQGLKDATGSEYRIDATDMVWVPWVLRDDARFKNATTAKRDSLKVLLCDEVQDTDLLQIEIFSLLIDSAHSFLIGVGDSKQAVYFFRGCLNDGMQRITERFNAENLPLPVCYRCGTEHLDLVREVFPDTPIQPRPDAPKGEIKTIWEKDFTSIFDSNALSYMGVCRKNAPLTIAAIRLLADGKPAKIKDRNIGNRLVSRVREICQRSKYKPETFAKALGEYETNQKRKLAAFPDGDAKISDLDDTLQAIWALFEHYEPKTLKAWEEIVSKIFDESGYSPISLYTVHGGKGGEGQVSFIICPDELPFEHPKQVKEEREQEDHLLYVALTRTLSDNVPGGGVLYLIIREDKQDGKPKYPDWLPGKYRTLVVEGSDEEEQVEDRKSEPVESEVDLQPTVADFLNETASLALAATLLTPLEQLEKEIREYFRNEGLNEPKLSKAFDAVKKVASGTMGRDDIDARCETFFSPIHRPAVKTFAERLCDLQESEVDAYFREKRQIEEHLEKQREALGMNEVGYEYKGEVQIAPDKILVKGQYKNSKTHEYTWEQGIPDWAKSLPVLYHNKNTSFASYEVLREAEPHRKLRAIRNSELKTEELPVAPAHKDNSGWSEDDEPLAIDLSEDATVQRSLFDAGLTGEPQATSSTTNSEFRVPNSSSQWISLHSIVLDSGTQSRKQSHSQTINDYAAEMIDGCWDWEKEPLPVVFKDSDRYYPGDGHHRIMAASVAARDSIFVEVRPGTLRDAVFYSTSANKYHGLPRTNADKRNQVELLLHDAEWRMLSDRAIAEHCGVSGPFVAKIRTSLAAVGIGKLNGERIGKNGNTIKVANIGARAKSLQPEEKVVETNIEPVTQLPASQFKEEGANGNGVHTTTATKLAQKLSKSQQTIRAATLKAEIAALEAKLAALKAELAAL